MKEVLKIVRGNEYPIDVYVEQMGYEGGELAAKAVDVREIGDLKVMAVSGCSCVVLSAKVSSGGEKVTVTVPSGCSMRLGRWGIRLSGVLNGRRFVSAERHVFTLVRWNGQDYVPPTLVDGEGSYLLNLKFAPADVDGGAVVRVGGWLGFAVFDDVGGIDLGSLQKVDDLCLTRTLHNGVRGARFVAVAAGLHPLSFTFAGMEASLDGVDYQGRRYYYTDGLIEGDFEVGIS